MAYFVGESLPRYALMKTLRFHRPLAVMCRVFDVSRSGYHVWVARIPRRRITAWKWRSGRRAGVAGKIRPPSVRDRSLSNGFEAGVWHIKRLCKKLGISYRQVRLWP